MATSRAAKVPALVYGTAWKKDKTRALVKQAMLSGFRGVDTAAQPKHYSEHLVGEGIRDALQQGGLRREDLYLQTKFTSTHGQDLTNLPYDPLSSITDQVKASITSSLRNFRVAVHSAGQEDPYIDCLILHSPYPRMADTRAAWKAMESFAPSPVRSLGLSNVYYLEVLRHLYDFATIKPVVLQNRFHPATGYDHDIRVFCAGHGIVYQSFWTLTANPHLLKSDVVSKTAEVLRVEPAVALYSLVLGLGEMSVLDGTTNAGRMKADLEGVEKMKAYERHSPERWREFVSDFHALIAGWSTTTPTSPSSNHG